MFQKYETNPPGLIFGGAFALILSVFGLRALNEYVFSTPGILDTEAYVVFAGDLIGVVVGILGLAMLVIGIVYILKARTSPGKNE